MAKKSDEATPSLDDFFGIDKELEKSGILKLDTDEQKNLLVRII